MTGATLTRPPVRHRKDKLSMQDQPTTPAQSTQPSVSKSLRFDIFRRDSFTCLYCGRRPPDVVLELDHVHPVSKGGGNDPLNLVTSCYDCNRGKAAKDLGAVVPRPDADLMFLEIQQEIAEMRRYQEARAVFEAALVNVIHKLQAQWCAASGLDWHPADHIVRGLLKAYSIDVVSEAVEDVAVKVGTGYISGNGDRWVRYLRVVARNMSLGTEKPA